jgi:hypothetical protein
MGTSRCSPSDGPYTNLIIYLPRSTWQDRRVVYTKDSVCFARAEDDTDTKLDE